MKTIKVVIFDFIGTLAMVEGYYYANSEEKLYECLLKNGFNLDHEYFINAYENAYEKYRNMRFQELL
jgi:phosphoglycolate phosphatase-like HAD superfamily hydrolase